jgi:hypothetical protein
MPLFAYPQHRPTYQKNLFLGINLMPLLLNTLDVRIEPRISRYLSLQFGSGFRYQNIEGKNKSTFNILENYVGLKNFALFATAGARVYDDSAWEYPYFAVDLSGAYYRDKRPINFDVNGMARDTLSTKGFSLGISGTLGFVIRVSKRTKMDLAIQAGYSPFREDIRTYYLPTMGFSTFGNIDRLSAKGLMVQPIITMKYDLVKDKRDRIREMP